MASTTRSLRSRTKRKDAVVDIANKKTPPTKSSSRQCEPDPKRQKNCNDSDTEVASKDKVRLLFIDSDLHQRQRRVFFKSVFFSSDEKNTEFYLTVVS